ncbi:hypothetical protein G1C97_0500 [Bifidobacterium sp. DSM 109959]|uniref:Uncharacterized protein n=1 Tax=Bifidobacterium olomucense TaxID=2675324 RepID=A0A7Y0EW71_9BIFI|nr:hypothetical protein [Bifidobacterium sp. DSM 109959]
MIIASNVERPRPTSGTPVPSPSLEPPRSSAALAPLSPSSLIPTNDTRKTRAKESEETDGPTARSKTLMKNE